MSNNGHVPGEQNGRTNGGPSHDPNDPRARERALQETVSRALRQGDELANHEAGSDFGRICRPLLLGPQRYRSPDIWGPDYLLRGAAPGSENTPEQIAEMKKVPLTRDERYQRVTSDLARLDAELGLPGPPD